MAKLIVIALCLVAGLWTSSVDAKGKNWALLVAGSNTWWNYRHQADICHAYHIMRKSGIPAENIITMMYDDIANNSQNPKKGVIINRPGGSDVYGGVVIDYKGNDVNSTNFLNILQGKKDTMKGIGSGRVIESDSGDNVFVNFADHGGVGLLCFPNEYLYADALDKALKSMSAANQFKKMVIYVEACEAGSMFEGIISQNDKIFVSTASASNESSWGCYCENEMNNCLGDLYSVTWMEHMDDLIAKGTASQESLFAQYQYVKSNVDKSHVQIYGDYSLKSDPITDYIGTGASSKPIWLSFNKRGNAPSSSVEFQKVDGVASRDIPLHLKQLKLKKATSQLEMLVAHQELTELSQKRSIADETVAQVIARVAGGDNSKIDEIVNNKYAPNRYRNVIECYKNTVEQFNKHCINTFKNTYLVRHFYKLVNLCSVNWTTEQIIAEAMASTCSNTLRSLSGII